MKKAAALLLLGLFITASFVFMTAVLADTPADPPEFYFTRLLYSEGGVRGGFFGRRRSFTMPKPAPFKCPEFGGKNFFPIQGWGWATDYPTRSYKSPMWETAATADQHGNGQTTKFPGSMEFPTTPAA